MAIRKVKHHPKLPKRLVNQVSKAIQKNKMENIQNPENLNSQTDEIKMVDATEVVPVVKSELDALISQNIEQKEEIGALVGLFLNFIPLFKDGVNPLALVSLIPKLLSDQKIKDQVGAILPIIEKYSA